MAATVLVLALVPSILAGEPPVSSADVKERAETVVITNDVLTNLYGPADVTEPAWTAPATPLPEPFLPDPLKQIDLELARRGDNRRTLYTIQKEITALEKRLEDLKTRRLAVSNPFLPRPTLTRDEAATWKELDGVGRVQQTEEAIEKVQTELERVQEAYTRAAQRV
jgi:hypothetical protein